MNMCFGLDKKGVDGYRDGEGNGPVCDDRIGAGIVPELHSINVVVGHEAR